MTREGVFEYVRMHEDFLAAVRAGIAEGRSRTSSLRGCVYAPHHLRTTGKLFPDWYELARVSVPAGASDEA